MHWPVAYAWPTIAMLVVTPHVSCVRFGVALSAKWKAMVPADRSNIALWQLASMHLSARDHLMLVCLYLAHGLWRMRAFAHLMW